MRKDACRSDRRASKPLYAALALGLALICTPNAASAQYASPEIAEALRSAGGDRDVRAFYRARGYQPLWVRGSALGPAADQLLELIHTAPADGLDPGDYRPRALVSAVDRARDGSPKALARAEMLLTRTFVDYVRDVRRPADVGITYVDRELAPSRANEQAILQAAAAAPSLELYLQNIGWMHPIYGQLRKALVASYDAAHAGGGSTQSRQREQMLVVNLERARALPTSNVGRYILVDAASARLWMYENGRVRDSMKVVVGKSSEQTPMMAANLRYALVNPYWNIPPDLARVRAQEVLRQGPSYLKKMGYQVFSDWSDNARVVDPSQVDWQGVAAGRHELPLRQLPGSTNAMGKVKFMMPNELGIYLHDTPERELLRKTDRRFSSGCVRVEDAPRLANWLFGRPLPLKSTKPDQRVDLPQPVPVYITYLTAMPEGQTVVYRADVYNRDGAQLAQLGNGRSGGR
jgi:murein L,D-transpeptidase YcbB/YkuD